MTGAETIEPVRTGAVARGLGPDNTTHVQGESGQLLKVATHAVFMQHDTCSRHVTATAWEKVTTEHWCQSRAASYCFYILFRSIGSLFHRIFEQWQLDAAHGIGHRHG